VRAISFLIGKSHYQGFGCVNNHPGQSETAYSDAGKETVSRHKVGECEPKVRLFDDDMAVRFAHSTRRAGEPATWGRGKQKYVVYKRNIDQT